jgi:hypothetical protein
VAQVYAGACPDDATRPPRQLAGFAKVQLAPGERARVSVELSPEALASWSPEAHAWVPAACALPLYVASSSRDVRLTGRIGQPGAVAANAIGGGCRSGDGGMPVAVVVLGAWFLARRRDARRQLASADGSAASATTGTTSVFSRMRVTSRSKTSGLARSHSTARSRP